MDQNTLEEQHLETKTSPAAAALLADDGVESGKKEYLEAPFSYRMAGSETVILNSGALQYTVTDFALPGKNGFGFSITRRYDSAAANEQDISPTNSLRTETRNNSHYKKTYGLGYGWSFVLPSIEIVPEAERKAGVTYASYLHLEDGRRMEITGNTFKDYPLQDVTIEQKAGAFTHPGCEGSWSYHYTVSYKDGSKDYFAEHRDGSNKLDCYKLCGRKDRFDNTIVYELADGGGMKIIDSWGRETSLVKEDEALRWTLPGGGVITYRVNKTCLVSVTDQVGRTTRYDYLPWTTKSGFVSTAKGGNEVDMKFWLLGLITHPTGAVTKYVYGCGYQGAPMELEISNYDGRRRSLPLRSRYDSYDGLVYNRVTYSYEMSQNKQYVQFAHVENEDKVKETHTFNEDTLRTTLQIWHAGKVVSRKVFAYGEEDHNKKLPVKEESWTYSPEGKALQKDTLYTYSEDKKGNPVKVATQWPTVPQYDQAVEMQYGDYSLVTERITRRDEEAWIIERSDLLAPDNKLVEFTRTYEKALDDYNYGEDGEKLPIETLRAKSQFVYDEQHRLTETRVFFGEDFDQYRVQVFAYDDALHTPEPVQAEARDIHDGEGNPVPSPYGDGIARTSYEYDCCGRVLAATDATGRRTETVYDLLGRPVRAVNADGTAAETRYDDRANRIVTVDENGNRNRTDYTPLGQVLAAYLLDPETLLIRQQYDAMQRLSREVSYDGRGGEKLSVAYTYDRHGRVLTSHATGEGVDALVTHTYSELVDGLYFRDVKTVHGDDTSPSMTTETYTDPLGRVAKTVSGDAVVTATYDIMGNTLTSTDPLGNVSAFRYDWAGRMVKATDALGHVTTAAYDELGRKICDTDAAGYETRYTYDEADRLLQQDAPFDGEARSLTRYDYNAAGELVRERVQVNLPEEEPRWRESEYRYDERGRRTDVILYETPDRSAWTRGHVVYDDVGNKVETWTGLTQYDSDAPHVARYTYDRLGNVLTSVDPRSCQLDRDDPLYREELYEYDRTGRLTAKTDRNGNRAAITYDALDRVVGKTVTVTNPSGTVTTEKAIRYGRTGNMLSDTVTETQGAQRSVLAIRYAYDHMGRLVRQEDPGDVVKTYAYDAAGNRTGFVLERSGAAAIRLEYGYDALGRLVRVGKPGQEAALAVYDYDIRGNRAQLAYPRNNTVTRYAYNDAGLLTLLENRRYGKVRSAWRYAYRLDGNQVGKTDHEGQTTTYRYDDIGRLLEESDPDWNTIRYEYDRFGNRSRMAVTGSETYETSYEYHPNNWLLREEKREDGGAVETTVYQYDGNGRQCYREWERVEAKHAAGARIGFPDREPDDAVLDLREYNGFGQLLRVFRDGERTLYRYRPDGLRHSKATGESVTCHHWDGSSIVMETCGSGLVKARYLRGSGLVAQQIDDSLFHYPFDGHCNVIQRVGADGNAAPMYRYDAFGNQKDPVATDPNPFRYCGEYHDEETGEIYLRNRSYSARNGRFTSEDPAQDGSNWYVYCGNNPVAYVDPTGLMSEASRTFEMMRQYNIKKYGPSYNAWPSSKTSSSSSGRDRKLSVSYVNERVYGDVRGAASGNKPREYALKELLNSGRSFSDDARESMREAGRSLLKTNYSKYTLRDLDNPNTGGWPDKTKNFNPGVWDPEQGWMEYMPVLDGHISFGSNLSIHYGKGTSHQQIQNKLHIVDWLARVIFHEDAHNGEVGMNGIAWAMFNYYCNSKENLIDVLLDPNYVTVFSEAHGNDYSFYPNNVIADEKGQEAWDYALRISKIMVSVAYNDNIVDKQSALSSFVQNPFISAKGGYGISYEIDNWRGSNGKNRFFRYAHRETDPRVEIY